MVIRVARAQNLLSEYDIHPDSRKFMLTRLQDRLVYSFRCEAKTKATEPAPIQDVYTEDLKQHDYEVPSSPKSGKAVRWVREDNASVVIEWDEVFGWSTWNIDENDKRCLSGRVWEVSPAEQGDYPTQGIWVSRKGEKSYVYEGAFSDDPPGSASSSTCQRFFSQ